MHSCLAVALDEQANQAQVLGLLEPAEYGRVHLKAIGPERPCATRHEASRPRIGRRWMGAIEQSPGPLSPNRWVYVADRESDIFEVLQSCWAMDCSLCDPSRPGARALVSPCPGLDLFTAAARGKVQGQMELEVSRRDKPVRLVIRSAQLELRGPKRPGGKLEDFKLNVVHAREFDPPPGQKPLEWVLLTDLKVSDLQACEPRARDIPSLAG